MRFYIKLNDIPEHLVRKVSFLFMLYIILRWQQWCFYLMCQRRACQFLVVSLWTVYFLKFLVLLILQNQKVENGLHATLAHF